MSAGERLRRAGIASWSLIGIVIVAALLIFGLWKIRIIFPPLVLAVLIIYVLNPVVSFLHRRRIPRILGTTIAYVIVLGGITLLIFATIPLVTRQATEVGESWPRYRSEIIAFVNDTADGIDRRFGTDINTSQVSCLLGADLEEGEDHVSEERCDEVTENFREAVLDQAGRLTEIGSSIFHLLLVFIIGPLIAFYLLADLPHLRRDFLNFVPKTYRAELADLTGKIGGAVGGFFRGQLVVALFVGALSALGFFIIDLPFWLIIGAIAGFFNLIPLVGPYIGGALGFFIGTISVDVGLGLKAALVELIVQQIDNHVLSPNIMKRAVNIHPVTVMLSILAGGTLAGFWGVLLGVPTVAVAKIVLAHVWTTRVLHSPPTPHAEHQGREPEPSVVVTPPAGMKLPNRDEDAGSPEAPPEDPSRNDK